MLIIRKDEVNNLIATVSMNKTLSNPYYLFSFQHIASKERVSFVPQVITSNCRYDKFRFVEFQTTDLTTTPPIVNFPYLGQYYYSIYEQLTSGNTDPSLAFNKLESGRAVVIVGNDRINECLFEPYISNDEDFANVIYLGEDEDTCIPNDCCISNIMLNQAGGQLSGAGFPNNIYNFPSLTTTGWTYNGEIINYFMKVTDRGEIDTSFQSNIPYVGGRTTFVTENDTRVVSNVFMSPLSAGTDGVYVSDKQGNLLYNMTGFTVFTGTTAGLQTSCFTILDDNSVVVAGYFNQFSGQSLSGIAKFDSFGYLDPLSLTNGFLYSIPTNLMFLRFCSFWKDNNGKIVLVNDSSTPASATYNGTPIGQIFRLNPDLSLDNTFQFSTTISGGFAQGGLYPRISFSNNDKIVVSWNHNIYSGYTSPKTIILNNDGSIDTNFVSDLTLTASSKIIYGNLIDGDSIYLYGTFDDFKNSGNASIVKVDFSGNVDTSFVSQSTTASTIRGMVKLDDGNFLITGALAYGGYTDDIIKINQFGQPMMCDPVPSPTPTLTITPTPSVTPTMTPTVTPTITATPSCPVTTQYLEVELFDNTKFRLMLWNNSGFTSAANAVCNYVISGTAYGSSGTTFNGEETITTGQHQHTFNLASVLLPGEVVTAFDVDSYYTSGCICPVNLILP